MKEEGKRCLRVLGAAAMLAIFPALLISVFFAGGVGGFIGLLLFFWIIIFLYFMPVMNAYVREKKNTAAIMVLNFLLGWTFLGWVAALVWSFTKD